MNIDKVNDLKEPPVAVAVGDISGSTSTRIDTPATRTSTDTTNPNTDNDSTGTVAAAATATTPGANPAVAVVQAFHNQRSSHHAHAVSITAATASDFCVSEHEDNDLNMSMPSDLSASELNRRRVSSESSVTRIDDSSSTNNDTNIQSGPAEIPPETDGQAGVDDDEDVVNVEADDDGDNDDDDESEYSYDYEEEDDGHYSGFLAYDEAAVSQEENKTSTAAAVAAAASASEKHIVEDEEPEDSSSNANAIVQFASLDATSTNMSSSTNNENADDNNDSQKSKSKWKEPTRAAVSMSLRAERETSGGRRRLAQDLYKVMMSDTEEAGFHVEQTDDACMDEWTVRLFKFDKDSDLHKDLLVLGLDHVELKMNFPEQYPFEPPFVRVVRPRFKRQTGFVMNGALCMELLTNEGWNPINDIESVIVSIRSLLVVGDGRLESAAKIPEAKRQALLAAAQMRAEEEGGEKSGDGDGVVADGNSAKAGSEGEGESVAGKRKRDDNHQNTKNGKDKKIPVGSYSTAEAKAAYTHLSNYHKKKGWSGWWAKRG